MPGGGYAQGDQEFVPRDENERVVWPATLDLADLLAGLPWTLVGAEMVMFHAPKTVSTSPALVPYVQLDKFARLRHDAPMQELSYSDARADLANLHEHALRHLPTRITRRRADPAVLLSEADFRALLSHFSFRPEVFFEASTVSIWLPELAIWGRGTSFAEARDDLLDEIEQLLGILESDERARLAPNMVERLPWIYRLMGAESDEQLGEILFAEPSPEAPPAALASA